MSDLPSDVQWHALPSGVVVPIRIGDASASAAKAVKAVIGPPGTSILAPLRSAGGPWDFRAAYELLRNATNPLTRIVDALLIGQHSGSYGGNIRLLNRGRARSVMGQHLVDPDDTLPIAAAMHLLQAITSDKVSVAMNRPAFLMERNLNGDVSSDRALLALRKRQGEGATDTGPWIEDDRQRTFSIQPDGTYYSQGGLFLFGTTANAILRGGSIFMENGGNLVCMGTGITSDDSTGFAPALAATTGGLFFIGDLYSSVDLDTRHFGDFTLSRPIDGGTAKMTSGALVLRELSAAQITALGTPTNGLGYFYVKDSDELPYFKDKDGVETALTGGGVGGVTEHSDLTGLADDDHTQYVLADGTRDIVGDQVVEGTLLLRKASTAFDATLDPDELTADRAISIPDESGTLALLEVGNVFTASQVIQFDSVADDTPSLVHILQHTTSGTAAAGFGVGHRYQLWDDADAMVEAGSVDVRWTDPGFGTEAADWVLRLARAGITGVEAARFTGQGALVLPDLSATPATPDAGFVAIYVKDGLVRQLDESGDEATAGGAWTTWAPTTTWTTATTWTGKYLIQGKLFTAMINAAFTNATDNVNLQISLPAGITIDTTVPFHPPSGGGGFDGANVRGPFEMGFVDASTLSVYHHSGDGLLALMSGTSPVTWGNGDNVGFFIQIPIT